jgi:nucleotide-binding universal stress UspA family protein
MHSLKSILVATNLTSANEQLIETVVNFSWSFGSRLTVLHVHPQTQFAILDDYSKQLEGRLTEEIAQRFSNDHAGVNEIAIETGPPVATILRKANEIDADLIALATGDDPWRVGPIAQAVIEHASQPVLAVRPGHHNAKVQTLLCPVDTSNTSKRGLMNAIRLAKGFGAHLHVVSVLPEVSWLTAAEQSGQLAHARNAFAGQWVERLNQFLAEVDFEDVPWTQEIRKGRADEEICAVAHKRRADLIIMGTTGLTGAGRILLGGTTRRVLHQLPCSLLPVKEEDVLSADYEGAIEEIHWLFDQAQVAVEANDDELALRKFDAVLRLNPFHIPALEGRAQACERMGDFERAERCHRRLEQLQRYPVLM